MFERIILKPQNTPESFLSGEKQEKNYRNLKRKKKKIKN